MTRRVPSWVQCCLLPLLGVASALLLVSLPRAVIPGELPALALSAPAVAAQQREDLQLAAAAPQTALANELLSWFENFGQTEADVLDNAKLRMVRQHRLHGIYERLRSESGPAATRAVRAVAVSKFEDVLAGRIKGEAARGWLGVFPNVLVQYLVTRDGLELAPHFVVRTLYKARWNRMLNLAAEDDLSQVERQAYFGWLGLHVEQLPMHERRNALLGYAAAGGGNAREAQGVLAFLDHDYTRSVECLREAYAQSPSLRLRNYLRGARVVAAQAGRASTNTSHEAWANAHDAHD
jgi:hypothetical protein